MVRKDGESVRLPRVFLPLGTRATEQITQFITAVWGWKVLVLDFLTSWPASGSCAVLEVDTTHGKTELPDGAFLLDIDCVPDTEICAEERVALKSMLSGGSGDRGPFARVGWLTEALDWIRSEIPTPVEFTGDIRQFNAGGCFTLIRLSTRRSPALWLKATGWPNLQEYDITLRLARDFPSHLPTVVAQRKDWNAWIMEDAGSPLSDSPTLANLERAVSGLASLQKEALPHANALRAVGVADQRIDTFAQRVDEVLAYVEESMANQVTTQVMRLDRPRLARLGRLLQDASGRMTELGIPDTLMHNDINPGNILVAPLGCVFIDWSDASIGNPFLTFESFCAHIRRIGGSGSTRNSQLKVVYKRFWRDLLKESQIEKAMALAPPLAIFSHLYGRGDWLGSPRRYGERFQSHSRSLARHIDRATEDPTFLEALC